MGAVPRFVGCGLSGFDGLGVLLLTLHPAGIALHLAAHSLENVGLHGHEVILCHEAEALDEIAGPTVDQCGLVFFAHGGYLVGL
jgi:hypothetical protein